MTPTSHPSTAALWARFRFSVVGPLLSSPPARGEIKAAIRALAAKTWTHPIHGRDVRFAAGTIERWYYTARREKDDPMAVLRDLAAFLESAESPQSVIWIGKIPKVEGAHLSSLLPPRDAAVRGSADRAGVGRFAVAGPLRHKQL